MTTTSDRIDRSATGWVDTAREIGESLADSVDEHDQRGDINHAAFDQLREAGITAAMVPRSFGGGGATHAEQGAIIRELARWDPATALTLSMHSHVVATQVWRHKHDLDATKVFEKVAEGAMLISTGASEWVGSNGTADRVEGGYRVTARKSPASGCEVGQILVGSVRWEAAPSGPEVLHFAIPMSTKGISIEQTWDTLGLRATGSHTIVLDDVFIPDGAVALSRSAKEWPTIWNVVLVAALPLIMSAYVGMADAAVAHALGGVAGRGDDHVRQLVGEMLNAHTTSADVLRAMFQDGADLTFAPSLELASRTLSRKTVVANAAIDCVRLAMETVGGLGYTRDGALERLYRDVHGCLFHPLPRAKQLRFSGSAALGLDPLS